MLDDEQYTQGERDRQNRMVKTALSPYIVGVEISALAMLLGYAGAGTGYTERTQEEITKIKASTKYIKATPEQRRVMVSPRRVGGGSTENQLVRRLFSDAPSARTRVLLPTSVLGLSRLDFTDGLQDPFLYSRVVLAQCVTGGMEYLIDQIGTPETDKRGFDTLAGAVRTAEEIDTALLEEENNRGIDRVWIDGTTGDWTLYTRKWIQSK